MSMKIVRVTRGATINLGNYESARVEIAGEYELSETDTSEEALAECDRFCREFLAQQIEEIQTASGNPPRSPGRFVGQLNKE